MKQTTEKHWLIKLIKLSDEDFKAVYQEGMDGYAAYGHTPQEAITDLIQSWGKFFK